MGENGVYSPVGDASALPLEFLLCALPRQLSRSKASVDFWAGWCLRKLPSRWVASRHTDDVDLLLERH